MRLTTEARQEQSIIDVGLISPLSSNLVHYDPTSCCEDGNTRRALTVAIPLCGIAVNVQSVSHRTMQTLFHGL
eukprot:m.41265 g.41265  ORF g.41265 m.41265 type:complete len:73 (+) comp14159_c0_seq1:241-459(+)